MAVVGNFYFSIFLRLTWKFLDLESERGGSVCWSNNNIIDTCQVMRLDMVISNKTLRSKNIF
jgi:hypothetical protein